MSVDILIPTRFSWDSIALTIESIFARTSREDYRIIVVDNSRAKNNLACEPHERPKTEDDGNRRTYLHRLAEHHLICLIEVTEQPPLYGHGENLNVLCSASTAAFMVLLNSNTEIISPTWLDELLSLLQDPEHDLGVARERGGGNHFDNCWITPTYWPNIMLLRSSLYRRHLKNHKWALQQIGFEDFKRPEIFVGQTPPSHPERVPPLVFCDTGWTLWEKLHYDNPAGLRMLPLPDNFWNTSVKWRGGIDRNSHRPDHPHVKDTLAEVKVALDALRKAQEAPTEAQAHFKKPPLATIPGRRLERLWEQYEHNSKEKN